MNITAGHHGPELTPELRGSLENRLKRIEGQVRGIQRMIDQRRYCADVLAQIASIQEALSGVGKLLLHNHLRHCATDAIRSGDPAEAERVVSELVELWR